MVHRMGGRTRLEPCNMCGLPAVRKLADRSYCATHASEIFRTFDPIVWGLDGGIGLFVGARDDGMADVVCSACQATWVGVPFERCGYCAAHLERALRWAAQDVLKPPQNQSGDAMRAWARRMAAAVREGVVTGDRANAAWRREVRRVA